MTIAPTISNLPAKLDFTEDNQASLDLTSIEIADPDVGGGDMLVEIQASSGMFARAATTLGLEISGHGSSTISIVGTITDIHIYLSQPTNILYTPQTNLSGAGAATITVSATDQVNPGEGPTVSAPIIIDITAVNDAPTATNLTQNKTAAEGGSAVALDDIVVTDVDTGDTITATLSLSNPGAGTLSTGTYGSATSTFNAGTGIWTVEGSVADVNAALAAVALTPSASNDQDFTISTQIRDAAGTGPANGTISVRITPANDAPMVTTSGGNTAATEGSSVVVDSGMTLSDPDNATMASATVSITGNFHAGEDLLAFTNDSATMGNISASYNAATGVMTLTSAGATATLAQWQAALRSVTYENSSQDPATTDRTISVVVNDGIDDSTPATKTITVTAVNDAPTITAPGTIAAAEGATTAVTGISFSDVDAGSAAVSATLSVPSGDLSAISSAGVMVGGTSSALTLTGTLSDINAFIAAGNVSYTPAVGGPADVDLTVTINDGGNTGTGGAQEDTTTVSLSVALGAPTPGGGSDSEPAPEPVIDILGTPEADRLGQVSGNARYFGLDGRDTVVYDGAREDYAIQLLPSGSIRLTGDGFSHTLNSIERIEFSDGALIFDIETSSGSAMYRLYGGAFGRAPDEAGLLFWIDWLNDGGSLTEAAKHFLGSDESFSLYGSILPDGEFVSLLYENVLDREGEQHGIDYWGNFLDNGGDPSDVLLFFTQLPEYVGISQVDIENGYWVIDA